jgi:hypothetical protein
MAFRLRRPVILAFDAVVQELPAERGQDQAASNADNGERDAEEYEQMNMDPARSRTLLIATRRASAVRSASVQEDVRARKIGAVPTGFRIGNNPAKTSRNALAKAVIAEKVYTKTRKSA